MTSEPAAERIVEFKLLHSGFSKFGIARVRLRDGTIVNREIEDHGSAAAVLPYDPVARNAVLVSQFRPPVLHAGEAAHVLEAPAGLLGEELPEACARREALEETGLELGELELVARIYSSPGISTERIHLFLAAFSPTQRLHQGGGLASEHEDLTVIELGLRDLADMTDRGEIVDMKTLALVMALRVRHPDLFVA
ncbi:MAG: NUDIX hydrolase [Methylobacteriaceae bacterium]|nr:NUDIX hydrolase [Methylobacteriaceae bacterium]MBV9245272.1 NUDIX hydrolase [Methylobacteriaceae bacterium]MBV9636421.1 NUDIX hydrolase [Methylobacteriaceae bacterium]MBV9704880.1 NUDIX hydrolase [Methylobacteriaceae bacterium]